MTTRLTAVRPRHTDVGRTASTPLHRPLPRRLAAGVLGLHGAIHLLGVVTALELAELAELPHTSEVLWGRVDIGEAGARLLGVGWLAAAVVLVAAAAAWWVDRPGARRLVGAGVALSLPLTLLASPEALAGVAVNLALAGVLVWTADRRGRHPA